MAGGASQGFGNDPKWRKCTLNTNRNHNPSIRATTSKFRSRILCVAVAKSSMKVFPSTMNVLQGRLAYWPPWGLRTQHPNKVRSTGGFAAESNWESASGRRP